MGYFATFADFLQMGKHGLYVWLSYGLAFTVFAYNIVSVALTKRQFFNKAKRQARREQIKS